MVPGPQSESYAKLQIDRQIIDGSADDFLGGFEELCKNLSIGSVVTGAFTQTMYVEQGPDQPPERRQKHTPFSSSLIDVYPGKKVRMVLLYQDAPFGSRQSHWLEKDRQHLVSNNFRRLNRITESARELDVDPKATVVECDNVALVETPGFGTELALLPQAHHIGGIALNRQIKKTFDELAEGRDTKQAVRLGTAVTAYAPFAHISADIDPQDLGALIEMVKDPESKLLPQRLVMGLVRPHSD